MDEELSMIYDGHAYCFPDQRGDGGFQDPAQFQDLQDSAPVFLLRHASFF